LRSCFLLLLVVVVVVVEEEEEDGGKDGGMRWNYLSWKVQRERRRRRRRTRLHTLLTPPRCEVVVSECIGRRW
jgi:hypothetical protein